MRLATRVLLSLLLAISGIRAAAFLLGALLQLTSPLEVFHLEAKMVHLAWRVQHHVRLYPDWRTGPYVANFFSPLYFVWVGTLGRFSNADLASLFVLGRATTLAATLSGSLGLGIVLGRQYGRGAGLAAALTSLGAIPLYGFGMMTRPDALADLLGLAGFAFGLSDRRLGRLLGAGVLILAVLTKQTAMVYLFAATLAEWRAGRQSAAIVQLLAVVAIVATIVLAVTWLLEPNFGPNLLEESRIPWSFTDWVRLLRRLVSSGPDLLVLAGLGLILWNTGGRRELTLTVLTLVLVATSVATSAKRGADLNYFLSLRNVEAFAVATSWRVVSAPDGRRGPWLAAIILAIASLLPSTAFMSSACLASVQTKQVLASPEGRVYLGAYERLWRMARDPNAVLLTDDGLLDIQRGERTEFADPWLFHMLVDTGRIDLRAMIRRVSQREYNAILTHHELFAETYDWLEFGLPAPVARAARARYRPAGRDANLFVYVPGR